MSSSLYNVHDPSNGGLYTMARSDHMSPTNGREYSLQRHWQRFNYTNLSSQSETNIPNLNNCSPPSFRYHGRLTGGYKINVFLLFNRTSSILQKQTVPAVRTSLFLPKKGEAVT